MQGDELTNAMAALEVDDGAWPVVVVRPAPARFGSEAWRLLHGLDGALNRESRSGSFLDLVAAGRGACVLVETALAERASPIAARCVGAATVAAPQSGVPPRLAQHPILFPFPSVSKPSVDEAVAWVAARLGRRLAATTELDATSTAPPAGAGVSPAPDRDDGRLEHVRKHVRPGS